MSNGFQVHIQLHNTRLKQRLEQWVLDCADLKLSACARDGHLHLWDGPNLLYERQTGEAIPATVVVLAEHAYQPDMDHHEQQALLAGALDYVDASRPFELIALRLSLHVQRLQHLSQLENLSTTDTLTGLHNRRKFQQDLSLMWRQGKRQKTPCALLLLDVDHFKRFNDSYGHLAGDQCLRELASVFRSELVRPGDVAARIGGEEFAILLPDTPKAGAVHVARRILERIKDLNILNKGTALGRVSASVGICITVPGTDGNLQDWQQRADDALYAAKGRGRNQIVADLVAAPSEAEIF